MQSPATPRPGMNLTYTLVLVNNGPGTATGVTLTNTPPAGSIFVSAAVTRALSVFFATADSCTGANPLVCTLGSLAPNERVTITHVIRLTSAGEARNQAEVSGAELDPAPENNTSAAVVPVSPAQVPPPELGATVNVAPAGGSVLVRLAGTSTFVPLASLRQIPLGSVVDTRKGRVKLTSARDRQGRTQTANFYGGIFSVLQPSGALTEARVGGGDFAVCSSRRLASLGAKPKPPKPKPAKPKPATPKPAKSKPAKPVRRLWGSGKGSFRTRGRYGSATVRGTTWLVVDRCDGTLVRVTKGSVLVRDFARGRKVVVKVGKSYLAKAPRR
jgi:uncharacterized repeat protein (TIGR01451 family)